MGLLLGRENTKTQYPYDQWYGVQGDFNSQDYKLKRVGNLDLHRTLPIQALHYRPCCQSQPLHPNPFYGCHFG